MENSASFGDWLRRRRKALDLTQEDLATQVGCSVGLIRKIEGDERRPSRQIAELLATALQIPTSEHDKFLKVARAQLRTERIERISPVTNALPHPRLLEPVAAAELTSSPSEAAPVTATPKPALPIPPTPLVGREPEVQALVGLLANPECRLLTIAGPGGMGKTRLALAVAASRQMNFAQGVYFVALAPLSSAEFMAPTIAHALGLTFSGPLEPKTQLLNYLREKQLLLVLDNLEHLLEGVELLSELLANAAELTLLATSRERLNLQGEWVFDLQGLPVPPLVAAASAPALPALATKTSAGQNVNLESYSALTLFVRSAQRAQASFVLSAENRVSVVRICRLVDGMPMGIELAAAWVHLLSCAETAQEIEHSIDFLAVNRRDLPERHRSLRAVFDHSWRLLSEPEKHVMGRLAVFRGGFTREAAEQVTGASLAILALLVTKSLVRRHESGRYDLHEVGRHSIMTRVGEATDGSSALFATQQAHTLYFLKLARTAQREIFGADQAIWLQRIEQEIDNLRAVFQWALEAPTTPADKEQFLLAAQLAVALYDFWYLHGYHGEGLARLSQLLAHTEATALSEIRAKLLCAWGFLQWVQGHFVQAEPALAEAVTISRATGDKRTCALSLNFLGRSLNDQNQHSAARRQLEESLAIWRDLDDPMGIAHSARELGDIAMSSGEDAQARQLYTEAAQMYKALNDANQSIYPIRRLGYFHLGDGDYTQAIACFQESLRINQEIGDQQGMAASIAGLAAVAVDKGQLVRATQLLGAVEAILQAVAAPLLPLDRREAERNRAALCTQLEEAEFTAAWHTGATWTLQQATAAASEVS